MEDEETRLCTNCKREIPVVNFTTHSVHCARNIKICPVCKEPVPSADLKQHHELLHKLLPCKQCGESVCGTDLEDHIRDSCANTVKTCRFCELELPRRELPSHEAYCGVRTEQCAECGEYVMIKYRQLHLDSNHGFIRLDDDPAPPKRDPKPLRAKIVSNASTSSTNNGRSIFDEGPRNFAQKTETKYFNNFDVASSSGSSSTSSSQSSSSSSSHPQSNGTKKRSNNQPQINTDTSHNKDILKDTPVVSRGAVKKRPAPAVPKDPKRDLAYYSAVRRRQREERERHEQNLYNAAHGLPPVLSPAAKLEKLRKMDAMQNPELAEEYRRDNRRKIDNNERRIKMELQNAKPMSPEEFMQRFSQLQVAPAPIAPGPAPVAPAPAAPADRFRDIKTSLTELRRGLNEVTAPYNANNNNNNFERHEDIGRNRGPAAEGEEEERLPCEFCDMMLLPEDLVQHQTGCRPDLAQYVPPPAVPPRAPRSPRAPSPLEHPVIPCEFCAQTLPVYLISEHQERCAREVDLIGD